MIRSRHHKIIIRTFSIQDADRRIKFSYSDPIRPGTIAYIGNCRGQKVAVKQLLSNHFALSLREIENLRESTHKNVIKYFYEERDQEFNYIAMELCDASLFDYVQGNVQPKDIRSNCLNKDALSQAMKGNKSQEMRSNLNEKDALRQAMEGLRFLHNKNIVHGNIRPQNILIKNSNDGNSPVVLISDYGIKSLNTLVKYPGKLVNIFQF